MAKRWTDPEKWKRAWFSDLTPKAKLAWFYVCDNCDNCGVWPLNFRKMSFDIGEHVTRQEFEEWFHDKFMLIEEDKYFFESFIRFQQKLPLTLRNNAHKPIITFLEKYKIPNDFVEKLQPPDQPLVGPFQPPDQTLERVPGKGKGNVNVFDSSLTNETREVNSTSLECLKKTWKETLEAFGHERNLTMYEERLIFMALKDESPEIVDRALFGARFEPKTKTFDPALGADIARILGDKNHKKPSQVAKFAGYAKKAPHGGWVTATGQVDAI